jgi:hypothetical protein
MQACGSKPFSEVEMKLHADTGGIKLSKNPLAMCELAKRTIPRNLELSVISFLDLPDRINISMPDKHLRGVTGQQT